MAGRGAGGAPTTYNTLALTADPGNYASTPDTADNSITGDIDIRVWAAPGDWTPFSLGYFVAKMATTSTYSYGLSLRNTGQLQLLVSPNQTTTRLISSTVATGFTDGTARWVRATRASASGTTKFYTSVDGTTWTQLGTDVASIAGGIADSNSIVEVGSAFVGNNSFFGKIYRVEIRNGIDGTLVNNFDATAVTKIGTRNPTSLVASTGETWTMTGAQWDWTVVAA